MSPRLRGDGSSVADRHRRVRINRQNTAERWRYVCPNGHTDWDRTNNHVWCRSCRHQHEHGADMDPEHWHIVDRSTGEEIPWSAVEIVEK